MDQVTTFERFIILVSKKILILFTKIRIVEL